MRALQTDARARRAEGRFVLEGCRLLEEARRSGLVPELVLHAPSPGAPERALVDAWAAEGAEVLEVGPRVLVACSDTEHPQGLVAVLTLPERAPPERPTLVLVCDAVADPANLGTILRTADAAGVDSVVLAPGTVDPWNPKVLRGGMGAQLRLPLVEAPWEAIPSLLAGLALVRAEAHEGVPWWSHDWRRPVALVLGGEARGPGGEARAAARDAVRIPLPGGAESLNVAVAAGVLLMEAVRQRSGGPLYLSRIDG